VKNFEKNIAINSKRKFPVDGLRVIIDGLQYAIRTQDSQTVLNNVEVDSDGDFEIEYEESNKPTLVTILAPSVTLSRNVYRRSSSDACYVSNPNHSPNRPSFVPTVVVPISDATMPTLIPKFVLRQDGDRDGDISSSTPPELLEKSFLPPSTRFFSSPVFSPPSVRRIAKFEASASVSSDRDENNLQERATSQVCIVEQQPSVDKSSAVELEAQHNEDGNESLLGSPSIQWNSLPSTPSSRRSSIVSNDTLCETSEFPSKRFSIGSYNGDSKFDSASDPALTIDIPSRSASFSDHCSITPELGNPIVKAPCKTDPSIIPSSPSPSSHAASDSIPSSSLSSPITPQIPKPLADLQSTSSEVRVIPLKSRIGLIGPLQMTQDDEVDEDSHQSTTVIETASYIVTGFLVGAFITLFLFSTQRRTLLYLT
jgi:hypothetical protein